MTENRSTCSRCGKMSFLKSQTTVFILLVILFLNVSSALLGKMKRNPKILVVGAGAAGVGAATKLLKNGFRNVQIVEAEPHIGGRIIGTKFGQSWIDLGAQYIHGASPSNPVYVMAKDMGLLNDSTEEESESKGWRVFSKQNKKIDTTFAKQVYEFGENIILNSYTLKKSYTQGQNQSMGEYFVTKIQELSTNWSSDPHRSKEVNGIFSLVIKNYLLDIGTSDLRDVGVDAWHEFGPVEGGELNLQGHMHQIVENLLRDFPKENILLSTQVTKIEWNGSFQGSEEEEENQYPVRVLCEGGKEILADHVLLTISVGCLKALASTLFHPILPSEKTLAIEKLGFGTMNKIFLEYDTPFWEEGVEEINLIWEDEHPSNALTSEAKEWIRFIPWYEVMPRERFNHSLIGMVAGRAAEYMETQSEEELASNITQNFREILGNPSIPHPKKVIYTKWHSNPYTRGAYTYRTVGAKGSHFDILAEPLPKDKSLSTQELQILFAGEGTSRNLHSTVQGALKSGWREAERLTKFYQTPGTSAESEETTPGTQ
ncbi:polyamine oxidase (exo-N4-amino) 1 isoform X1 [Erpetoichthys calabaricus]|uniref:polyamine oxidase (exo-N4-amino) 1 isoform X1 n=2 Tax=Erpetoichthys calabaricus TaxID=27687 RepID=UPI0022348088|nr:polyamine oxidase (exo-N4-amino) 1 isoform X1 [Erpetoichthys calabaricus]XP_028668900.2 polyamine oxidase (exo-N4-amino) 1 isoform X1 [Erpetoichthys calabaricus]XP_051790178.1 polyamine oxidase (exo-N4-amino) 1 isoform X1 [Erpetoichthys calabaricus]